MLGEEPGRIVAEAFTLPGWLIERLRERAAREGKTLEDLVLTLLSAELDPSSRIEAYKWLFYKLLREAEELYERGDFVQAGEKLWGAVAALLNIIGELEGRPHYRHTDYWEIVEDVVRETGDAEYSTLFRLAEGLHANYYYAFLSEESFKAHWGDVKKLIEKLRRYIRERYRVNI